MVNSRQNFRAFLCHGSEDKNRVEHYYERLKNDGVNTWFDKVNLIPGQDWRLEIPKAVRDSDIVIIFLSSQSVDKVGYVQKEIKIALDAADERPDGNIFIIPARLEDCRVPERISKFQWVNLFEKHGYKILLNTLHDVANKMSIAIKHTDITNFEFDDEENQEIQHFIQSTSGTLGKVGSSNPVSKKAVSKSDKYEDLRFVFYKKILPLSEKILETWPELERSYIKASPESKFETILLYDDLVDDNKDFDLLQNQRLNEYISDFFRAILEGKTKLIQNTGLGVIRDVVEEEHKKLIQIILNKHFNGNSGELQKAMKADNSLWEKWGLAKWSYYYRDWSRNRNINMILTIPAEVQQYLSNLGLLRNHLAHDAPIGKMDVLITQVRECFNYTYKTLLWINNTKFDIQNQEIHQKNGSEAAI